MTLTSSPFQPAALVREIGDLSFALDTEGLRISSTTQGVIHFDVADTLAIFDFVRTAGARQLVNRAWLAEQHAAAITEEN